MKATMVGMVMERVVDLRSPGGVEKRVRRCVHVSAFLLCRWVLEGGGTVGERVRWPGVVSKKSWSCNHSRSFR